MNFKHWLIEMAQNTKSQLEQLGYEFRVENYLPRVFSIQVYVSEESTGGMLPKGSMTKKWVGEASFTQDKNRIQESNPHWADVWDDSQDDLKPNQMWVTNLWVDEKHQRLGIASAMYQLAQQVSGNQIVRTPSTTSDSDAVWAQKNRPF